MILAIFLGVVPVIVDTTPLPLFRLTLIFMVLWRLAFGVLYCHAFYSLKGIQFTEFRSLNTMYYFEATKLALAVSSISASNDFS